jgi:type VI secretion system protein ImpG
MFFFRLVRVGGKGLTRKLFHIELSRLKELAAEFADANPALAPLLSGPMTDPDVERLLEAVAFQNGLLGRKLGVDFPELIQKLAQLILPHYLRPVPANTIIAFTPKPSLGQSVTVPAGTQLASAPVDGTSCRFTTTCDLEIHPLELTDAAIVQTSDRAAEIRLSFTLHGLSLSQWRPQSLRLFLAGDRASATELYQLLSLHVTRIVLAPMPGGTAASIPPACLKLAGFDEREALLPYPPHAFPGYRLLQEYFNVPEKFLFFELTGWERWTQRGDGGQFTASFELDGLPSGLPRISRASFVLYAVPAVNIFSHDADPVHIDHHTSRYLIRPSGPNPSHYQIFSVDRVTGFSRETGRERCYAPFELFHDESPEDPIYHVNLEQSPVRAGFDVHLSVAFPGEGSFPEAETLSIELTCTNGTLPGSLRIGDICTPASTIPESVFFSNVTPVNPGVPPHLGHELLWQLTCHIYLNHVSLACAENLRTLLRLYVFQENSSNGPVTANLKRIAGIGEVSVLPGECLVSGVSMRGSEICLKVRQDHFAGTGDLYLFGCVLDHFLAGYASINSFTRLVMDEILRGGSYRWPMRQE